MWPGICQGMAIEKVYTWPLFVMQLKVYLLHTSKSRDEQDHKIQDGCYFRICTSTSTKGIVGCGKSNLASNNVEDIDLPIVFVSISSTL